MGHWLWPMTHWPISISGIAYCQRREWFGQIQNGIIEWSIAVDLFWKRLGGYFNYREQKHSCSFRRSVLYLTFQFSCIDLIVLSTSSLDKRKFAISFFTTSGSSVMGRRWTIPSPPHLGKSIALAKLATNEAVSDMFSPSCTAIANPQMRGGAWRILWKN